MPGPPPKHPSQRRRQNPTVAMTSLPAEGRKGPTPEWPLARPRKAELDIWVELWGTPQSVAWERLGHLRTVARYVRLLVEAEKPGAPIMVSSEVRQLEDRLGLTPMSMLRLRWEIVADEVSDAREERRPPKRRLAAVDTSALAGS